MQKQRYWLYRRGGVFYLHDSETNKPESLATRSRREAEKIRIARNEAAANPKVGFALARYLITAHDEQLPNREWQGVFDEYCSRGKPPGANMTVTGEYLGRYRGGFETITVKPDGIFHQELRSPEMSLVNQGDGKWSLSGSVSIGFSPFIGNIDSSETELENHKRRDVASVRLKLNCSTKTRSRVNPLVCKTGDSHPFDDRPSFFDFRPFCGLRIMVAVL